MGLFSGLTDFFAQGQANESMQDAANILESVNLPDIDAMKLKLREQVQQGIITPEMANTILQEQTAMAGVSTDPRLKNAQLNALAGLEDIASQKGMTVADKARLNEITGEENARERGQREAILQNAQQRGVGGSGLELSAQLANQQGSAGRASQRGFDVAKEAQQRALDALINSGTLGGNIRSQDFSEQSAIAQAKDAINKFNTANRNTVNMSNVAAKNQAQYANLGEKQRIADTNVGLGNTQQMYNKQLLQQQYENELRKKQAQANVYMNQATNYQQGKGSGLGSVGDTLLQGAATGLMF